MKSKLAGAVGLLVLLALVFWSPFEPEQGGFSDILRHWGREQEELSDALTTKVVSPVEGEIVGEHREDGSNWSIPNILRNWFGLWD